MTYEDIRFETNAGIATLTIARPENGNMFRRETTLELADALRMFRDRTDLRVLILTGEGDRFFCIGGEHSEPEPGYSEVLPIVDVYELIDSVPKPVIAAVNGFAVGGGHVLHMICDLSIAAEHAIFRQVGPVVGSFDAGFGTWYLEDTIGRKRAKEMWYLNSKYTAAQALAMGLVNEVVSASELMPRAYEVADQLKQRGPGALAGLKAAFSSRHTGVIGQARIAHDQLLTYYLATEEHDELSASFREHRAPNEDRFLK